MANKDTWPQIIEGGEPTAWKIKLRFFDGMTKVAYSGGTPYFAEVPGAYSFHDDDPWDETVDQVSLDSQHPYVRQPVDVTRTVRVASDPRISETTIANEYGPEATNPLPWTRKPIYQPTKDNRHTGRVWDRSGTEWANLLVSLKTRPEQDPPKGHNSHDEHMDDEAAVIKLKPKMLDEAWDGDPHPRDPNITNDKPLEYELVLPSIAKFFLTSRELGSTSIAHFFHDQATTFGRGHSWLESREPSGIFYHSFDTSDTVNYKVTSGPSFADDEVPGKVIGPGTWDVFLIPRRWAYYVRFSRIEKATTQVDDDYPFSGVMVPPAYHASGYGCGSAEPDEDWGTPAIMHYMARSVAECNEAWGDPYYRITETVSDDVKEATVVYQSYGGAQDGATDYESCRYHRDIPDPNGTGNHYLNHEYELTGSVTGYEWTRTGTTRNGGTETLWYRCDASDGTTTEVWRPSSEGYCDQELNWSVDGNLNHKRYVQKHHHRIWLFWGRPPEALLHWNYNTDDRPLRMVKFNWSDSPNGNGDYELDDYYEHEIDVPGVRTQSEIQAEYDASSQPFGAEWEALCGDTCNSPHITRNGTRWACTNYGDDATKEEQVWDPGVQRSMPDHGAPGWAWYNDGSYTLYHLRPFRHLFPDEEATSMGELSLRPLYHVLFQDTDGMSKPSLESNFYKVVLEDYFDDLVADGKALYPQPDPIDVEDEGYSVEGAGRLEAMSTSGRQPFGVGLSPSLAGQLCAVIRRGGQRFFVWRRTDEAIEEVKVGSGHGFLGFEADETDGDAGPFRAHVWQHRRDRPGPSSRWDGDYGDLVYGVVDDDTGDYVFDWYEGQSPASGGRAVWHRCAWAQPDITFAYPFTGDATGREHTHLSTGLSVADDDGPVDHIGGYHAGTMKGTGQGDALPASVYPMISREWYGTSGRFYGWKWNGSQYVDADTLSYHEAAALGDNAGRMNRRGRAWLPLMMDGDNYDVDEGDW